MYILDELRAAEGAMVVWEIQVRGSYIVVFTDKIKDQVIAKIAMQASDLYADALINMQVGSIKSMWDRVSAVAKVAS